MQVFEPDEVILYNTTLPSSNLLATGRDPTMASYGPGNLRFSFSFLSA